MEILLYLVKQFASNSPKGWVYFAPSGLSAEAAVSLGIRRYLRTSGLVPHLMPSMSTAGGVWVVLAKDGGTY
jgi:hypothetical protein